MRDDSNDESETPVVTIPRRRLLELGVKTAGAVSLLGLGTALARESRAASRVGRLNLVSWGGAYQHSQIEAYEKPYTHAEHVAFNNIEKSASGPAMITAQSQSGNISWDVVDILQAPAERLCSQGMLVEFDFDRDLAPAPDGTPPTKDFVGGSLSGSKGCFVPEIAYDTLLSYNKKAFSSGHEPATVADVFDLEKFPGTRALQKIPAGNLEWALYADGVARGKVYDVLRTPHGVDRAFKKLDTIKSQCIWWTQGAQPPQMLAQQQAVIASAYNGRIFNAIVANEQPLDFIWDGGLYEWDGWVVPAGLPKDRMQAAKAFVRYSTDTKRLAAQARYIAYAPARHSSIPLITTYYKKPSVEMTPYMPTTKEHLAVAIPKNVSFWVNYGPQLQQRFSAWLAA